MRSNRFDTLPPIRKPSATGNSTCREPDFAKCASIQTTASAVSRDTTSSRPGKMPNAIPVLRRCVISRNGSTWWPSPSAMRSTIRCLVTWSATTTAAATATSPRSAASAPAGGVARSAPFLEPFALDALGRVWQRLQPLLRDRLGAALALAVRAGVDPAKGGVDAGQQMLRVVLERLLDLAVDGLAGAVGQVRVVAVLVGLILERVRQIVLEGLHLRGHAKALRHQSVTSGIHIDAHAPTSSHTLRPSA